MTGDELLTIAGAVARSWSTRYGVDYDELRGVLAMALVEAEPVSSRQAFDVADWTAGSWCYHERCYQQRTLDVPPPADLL